MTRKPHVRFYTRLGCHLCEEAKREIRRAGSFEDYTFEEIDVDMDAGLVKRFGMDIPVVTIDEVVVFKHRLTAEEFKHQLRSLSARRS
jgi:glutaredoxin